MTSASCGSGKTQQTENQSYEQSQGWGVVGGVGWASWELLAGNTPPQVPAR